MKAPWNCPVCNSYWTSTSGSYNSGFSYGKAALGSIVFGPVGAVAGLAGKKKITYHCNKCGYTKEYDA